MKVKCIRNILPKELATEDSEYTHRISCIVGQEYLVMAVGLYKDGRFKYYVNECPGAYPWYSHHYFEIIDARMPPSWIFQIVHGNFFEAFFSFPEFCNEDFYVEMFDGPEKGSFEDLSYKRRVQEILDWYRDLEVLDYLEKSDFSDVDKLEIIQYYRSKPISQWEEDKPLLMG